STGLAVPSDGSSLRRVRIADGHVLQMHDQKRDVFAEGLALLGGHLFQLTWKEHRVFVYDRASFKVQRELRWPREGWGLTTDGKQLIVSDGTPEVFFVDPATF